MALKNQTYSFGNGQVHSCMDVNQVDISARASLLKSGKRKNR